MANAAMVDTCAQIVGFRVEIVVDATRVEREPARTRTLVEAMVNGGLADHIGEREVIGFRIIADDGSVYEQTRGGDAIGEWTRGELVAAD